jgi:hypothetical protein
MLRVAGIEIGMADAIRRHLAGVWYALGMASQMTLFLPGVSWTDDTTLTTAQGSKLRRYGSVRMACRILDGCDRHTIYDLKEAGVIRAYKHKAHRRNSHLRVDLSSDNYKSPQRQL